MKNTVITGILTAIIFGLLGFFAGTKFRTNRSNTLTSYVYRQQANIQPNGQQQMGGGMMGPRQVIGEILAKDDKSITVKMQDGSSRIIFINDATTVLKSTTAAKTDLKVGEKVAVFGPTNTDGSITANNIQLNPSLKFK